MNYISSGAVLSPCLHYRYALWREWKEPLWADRHGRIAHTCLFIMLNPSTGDAEQDDPTIRKCVGFAQRWGYTRVEIVNLFAYRATDPADLLMGHALNADAGPHLTGPLNKRYVQVAIAGARRVVLAWGQWGAYLNQDHKVLDWIREADPCVLLKCLGFNGNRTPKHPLMPSYNTPLVDFVPRSL